MPGRALDAGAGNRSAFSEDALRRGQRFQMAFVRATCWLFVLAPVATGALHVLTGHADRLPGVVPFSVLGFAGLWLLAHASTRTAFVVLAYGGWLCTLNIALWTGGLSAPALTALPVIIALAGWLAGPRASLLLMAASAPYLLVLAAAARGGWGWPALATGYDPFHLALVYGLSTTGAGFLGYFAARSNDAYIANLQESERALREKVEELTARERELASASDSFETLFRASPDAMTLTRLRDDVVIDVNEAFTRNSGYARDRIVGHRSEELSLWADPALRTRLIAELLGGHPVLDRAMQARHNDGRPLTIRFSGACVNIAGEPHLLAVSRDVTAQEATREALAQRERDLDAANRSLAFQVSLHEFTERIARVGHWTSSRSRDTLQWSDTFFELCGVQRRGPMPSGGYRDLIRIVDQEAFDAARDRLDGTPAVYRITLADGSPRWFRASLHRPPGAGEGNDECLGVAQDITGEHEAKLALERLNAELEQRVASRTDELRSANDELDAFAYSVAHDLTAPLRAINGFAALIESDWAARLDDAGRSHLGRIRQASSRMASLIEDLLRLSHVTRTNLDRRPLDLSALAREVAAELSAADPGRTVTWHIEEGLAASADRGLARVLLANLLGNAWKYTRDASHPEIALERATDEGRPDEFRVRDNGVGFDMAHAAQLFAPFRRLHGPQEFEGNGIGLATVHRIVRRHGGEVRARGEPGRGASFFFTLPPPPSPMA